jgi:hypothetical protein
VAKLARTVGCEMIESLSATNQYGFLAQDIPLAGLLAAYGSMANENATH